MTAPSVPGLAIRPGRAADAEAIGTIHVRAWQEAYRGVMPDDYLDTLSIDERAEMWRRHLTSADAPPILVAEVDGVVVGFAVFGRRRPVDEAAGVGELYAINLDPSCWGRGIGRALLRAATSMLADLGFREAVLWVVPQNARARGLYEQEGWSTDGGLVSEEILGVRVDEIRYHRTLEV